MLVSLAVHGPPARKDTITWTFLNNVQYTNSPHDTYDTVYLPTFSPDIQTLHPKTVITT